MARRKKYVRGVLRCLGMGGLLLLLVYGALHTSWGRRWLAGKASQAASKALHAEVVVQGLSGWLPVHLKADHLRMEDAGGLCLEVKGLSAKVDVASLFRKPIRLHALTAEELTYRHLPPPTEKKGGPPPRIELPLIQVNALYLPEVDPDLQVAVAGSLATTDGLTLAGTIEDAHTRVVGAFDQAAHSWNLRVEVASESLLQRRIPLPEPHVFTLEARQLPTAPVQIDLSVADLGTLHSTLTRTLVADRHRYQLTPKVAFESKVLPPELERLLGAVFETRLDVHQDAEGAWLVEVEDLQGQGVSAHASIRLGAEGELNTRYNAIFDALSWPLGTGVVQVTRCVVTGTVARVAIGRPLMIELDAQPQTLTGLPGDLSALIGQTPRVQLRLVPGATNRVEQLVVRGEGLRLTTQGSFTTAHPALEWALDLPDLSRLSVFSGKSVVVGVQATGHLSGTWKEPALALSARLPDLRVQAHAIDAATVELETRGGEEGSFRLGGTWRDLPLQAGGVFAKVDEVWLLNNLWLSDSAQNAIRGSLSYTPEHQATSGRITGTFHHLDAWQSLLNRSVTGRVDAAVQLEMSPAGFQVAADLALEELALNAVRIEAAHLGLIGDSSNTLKPWALTGRVTRARFQQLVLPAMDVQGQFSTNGFTGGFAGELTSGTNVALRLAGAVHHTAVEDVLALEQASGEVLGQSFALEQPLMLYRTPAVLMVPDGRFRWGATRLAARGLLEGDVLDAELNLEPVPLAQLPHPAVQALTGELAVSVLLSGPLDDLNARLEGRIANFGSSDPAFEDVKPVRLALSGSLTNRALSVRGVVANEDNSRLVVTGSLPANAAIRPFQVQVDRTGDLAAAVKGQIDLRLLNALPFAFDQRVEGMLDVDILVKGQLDQPVLGGRMSVRDGWFEHYVLGTQLHQIQLEVEALDQEIHLRSLRAIGPQGGRLSGGGRFRVGAGEGPPLDVRLTLEDLRLVQNDVLRAYASGDLQGQGSFKAIALKGKLSLAPVDVHVPRFLPPSNKGFTLIDPQRPVKKAVSPDVADRPSPLTMDIQVDVPGRLQIEGRGLQSEWAGTFRMLGDHNQPRISGELRPRRGRFDFFGQPFRLKESSVRFAGGYPPQPTLDLVLERQKGDLLVYLKISGTAREPVIRLVSEPPLPQDELLPRLLFGKEAGELSPLQALKIARAGNALKGGTSAFDVMGRVRSWLDVDELELDQAGSEDALAKVRVGKALNDQVYLEGESELGGGENRLRLEVEMTPRLSLESDLSSELKRGIGLKWKRKF
ncbi:MAG: autotransporter translocation and assembly factor TamB [Candidatus Omnitrophota bacterium]|jgi:autotransporter translocation and assembly factor TamB